MCGRFTLTADQEMLKSYIKAGYDIQDVPDFDIPRYNIAPTQQVIALLHDGNHYRVGSLKWGLIPSFAKDTKALSIINAKAETLYEKPAFKDAFYGRRCIVLADGFYEWKKVNQAKKPMYIYLKNHSIFAMAGIWHTYVSKDGQRHHTVALVTTKANALMADIHDRMPVILSGVSIDRWLDVSIKDTHTILELLSPYDSDQMQAHEVSLLVNTPKNDIKECIKAI